MALRGSLLLVALWLALLLGGCEHETTDRTSQPDARPTATERRASPPPGESSAEPVGGGPPRDAVLYTIGLSTDPYGRSRPAGFGVATGVAAGRLRTITVRRHGLGWFPGALWLANEQIVVARKPSSKKAHFQPPLLFRLSAGRLERLGAAPLRGLESQGYWSPDGTLIATEPVKVTDCEDIGGRPGLICTRQSGNIFVAAADGSGRRQVAHGHLGGWTPAGRLLLTNKPFTQYKAVDILTGDTAVLIAPEAVARLAGAPQASVGTPIWSADREYMAAFVSVTLPDAANTVGTLVVAAADGRPLRLLTSPYIISMFAWSPTGHQLAWTTSGFPDPHQLFVVDDPAAEPRKLFATGGRHFDWITWSPDGRLLLIDDENFGPHPDQPGRRPRGRWLLLDTTTGKKLRALPRLGGAPQWCCPTNPSSRH